MLYKITYFFLIPLSSSIALSFYYDMHCTYLVFSLVIVSLLLEYTFSRGKDLCFWDLCFCSVMYHRGFERDWHIAGTQKIFVE